MDEVRNPVGGHERGELREVLQAERLTTLVRQVQFAKNSDIEQATAEAIAAWPVIRAGHWRPSAGEGDK